MDEYDIQLNQIIEVALVHDHQPCAGLPFCVACRAVALLRYNLNPIRAEEFIAQQPEGKVIKLERRES